MSADYLLYEEEGNGEGFPSLVDSVAYTYKSKVVVYKGCKCFIGIILGIFFFIFSFNTCYTLKNSISYIFIFFQSISFCGVDCKFLW